MPPASQHRIRRGTTCCASSRASLLLLPLFDVHAGTRPLASAVITVGTSWFASEWKRAIGGGKPDHRQTRRLKGPQRSAGRHLSYRYPSVPTLRAFVLSSSHDCYHTRSCFSSTRVSGNVCKAKGNVYGLSGNGFLNGRGRSSCFLASR